MVFAHSDIEARIVDGATLTNDDVASNAFLTAKDFNAETFALGFATVA